MHTSFKQLREKNSPLNLANSIECLTLSKVLFISSGLLYLIRIIIKLHPRLLFYSSQTGNPSYIYRTLEGTVSFFNKQEKVRKGAKIRNRYNQVPHLTQDINGKVTNSQLDTTRESQEVSSFPAGDHKAQLNRRAQRHSKHKAEQKT